MSFIALVGALATILGGGFGTLRLLVGKRTSLNLAEQLALSWLLGTGVISLLVWLLGFFFRGWFLPTLVASVSATLAIVTWRSIGRSAFSFQSFRKMGRIDLLLAAVLALEVAVIFYLSYVHTLGWDGLQNWEIKARYAYANAGVIPGSYLRDAGRGFTHPEYPLAIPFTELWVYFWLGDTNQFWTKTLFPLFYSAGVVLLVAVSARFTGKSWPGLVTSILLFFIPQVSTEGGSAIVGYADFPLSVFYLATIGYLVCAARSDDAGYFRVYCACLALLPWVKCEGAILWLVAALCGAALILKRKKSAMCLLALIPGLVVIIAWRFYLSGMHAVSSSDFGPVTLVTLRSNIHRLGPIISMLFSEFTRLETWSLFWLLVAVGSTLYFWCYRDLRSLVLAIAVAGPISIYSFTYIFSSWPDYLSHVGLSISRLLMHVTPLFCLILSGALVPRSTVLPLAQSPSQPAEVTTPPEPK
jgi:hypothetical protein